MNAGVQVFVYPEELDHTAPDALAAQILELGCDAVSVSVAYHRARRVFPRHRRVSVLTGSTLYVEPSADRYGPLARLAKAEQRLETDARRDERAVAVGARLDVQRAAREHAHTLVAGKHAARAVVRNRDRDGVAAELEDLRRQPVRRRVVELLGIDEDLNARVHEEKLRRTSSLGSTPSPGPSGSRATTPSIASGVTSVASSS